MLTGTTELAIRAVLLLGLSGGSKPIPPRRLAETLGCSPTYLGKTVGHLVRSDILKSTRGARGGVVLARDPSRITLLDIVEACQGTIVGDYCREVRADEVAVACRFHRVMAELHGQLVRALSACTLAELLACPVPASRGRKGPTFACRMTFPGVEDLIAAQRKARREEPSR